ncbi:RTA1 like protein-domain-containing protein [Collybia nuda]|uniref:RTA1 like protein-domain-containing protein n=1 Tax=Collybia nuda TaxID=64659 RepID=A0A9P5Y413_9AGAR|nr:RTA1 like protein-domain-containing protein [Collybia nuda]
MASNGTSLDTTQESPYNYVPTRAVAFLFIVLFGISTATHVGQAIRYRMWWLFPTVCIAGAGEVAGWAGRLWSSYSVLNRDAFMLQITTTILAPTPMVAANFIIFSRLVNRLGTEYSRLPPRWYTVVFFSCDIISLLVQGAGGGLAASSNSDSSSRLGSNIMLAGIAFQLVTLSLYSCVAIEYFIRYMKDKPLPSRRYTQEYAQGTKTVLTPKLKIMALALAFNTTCLFIRAVYRTIELADGWTGRIISTEVYFNVLDGGMVVLAIYAFNFAHPGVMLQTDFQGRSEEFLALKDRAVA